jgi:uncharacterized protein (DUF1697 family)
VRSREQLKDLVAHSPFRGHAYTKKHYLTVTFLKHPAAVPFALPFRPSGKSYTLLAAHSQELFCVVDLTDNKAGELMVWLEKHFSKAITTRTWNTVQKIIKKLDE